MFAKIASANWKAGIAEILGKLFHTRGPATQNDRWPKMLLQRGTVQRQRPDDRTVHRTESATISTER